MAPFWAKWWAASSKNWSLSTGTRIALVISLSVGTLLVTFVGPWLTIMMMHGRLIENLFDPNFPFIALIFFGPGIALQTFLAYFAARDALPK